MMLMHRDEVIDPTKDIIVCNVAKNRNGEERASKFLFDKSIGRFSTHVETRLNDTKTTKPPFWDYIVSHSMPLEAPEGC